VTPVLLALLVAGLASSVGPVGQATARAVARRRARQRLVGRAERLLVLGPVPSWAAGAHRRLGRRAAARRYEDGLPDALDHVAASVRAGASTVQSFRSAAEGADREIADDLMTLVRQVEAGEPLEQALDGWRRRRPLPGVALTAAALGLGARFGGRQATAIDAIADAVRTRLAVRREVWALSAQARASALVMSITPLVFAAVAAALDPRVAGMLLGRPLGWACLAAGLAMNAAGAGWMAQILASSPGGAS
jgi:tight adherence protein B